MDGRQLYNNYAGNMQGAGYYNTMPYGRGHAGMPVPYGSGPPAAAPQFMPQQLGATIPGLTHPYGSQSGLHISEDPSLYVNFDDEEEEFQNGRRVAMNFEQQNQRASATAHVNAPSRLRQSTNSAALPQSRPSSGTAAKPVATNAADQELENLRRRIAEKERQIKAQRQSSHANTGSNHVARLNPALGPVLRGLHRKQSPAAEDTSKQVDAFLKEVTAGAPSKPAGVKPSAQAAIPSDASAASSHQAAAPSTKAPAAKRPVKSSVTGDTAHPKAALVPVKSQPASKLAPAVQQPKESSGQDTNTSGTTAAQLEPMPADQSNVAVSLNTGPPSTVVSEGKAPANSGKHVKQAETKVRESTRPVVAARQAPREADKASTKAVNTAAEPVTSLVQNLKQAAEPAKVYAKRTPPQPSKHVKQAQGAPVTQAPAKNRQPQQQGTSSKAAAPKRSTPPPEVQPEDGATAQQRQPSEGASDSDLAGVAFQSGYHMSDSPVLVTTTDEEEEVLAEPVNKSRSAPSSAAATANSASKVAAEADKRAPSHSAASEKGMPKAEQPGADATAAGQQRASQVSDLKCSTVSLPNASTSSRRQDATPGSSAATPIAKPATVATATPIETQAAHPVAAETRRAVKDAEKAVAGRRISATAQPATALHNGATPAQNTAKKPTQNLQNHNLVNSKASENGKADPPSRLQQPLGVSSTKGNGHLPLAAAVTSHKHTPVSYSASNPAVIPGLNDHTAQIPGLHDSAVTAAQAAGDIMTSTGPNQLPKPDQGKPDQHPVKQPVRTLHGDSKSPELVATAAPAKAKSVREAIPKPTLHAASLPRTVATAEPVAANVSKVPADSRPFLHSPQLRVNQHPNSHEADKAQLQQTTKALQAERLLQPLCEPPPEGKPAGDAHVKIPALAAEPSSPKPQPAPRARASTADQPPPAILQPLSSTVTVPQPWEAATTAAAGSVSMLDSVSAEGNPPLPPSDSGESMDIDEDQGTVMPLLPRRDSKAEQLQLATVASSSSWDEVALVAADPQDKLKRLSQIEAQKQELRDMKQVLNNMMARTRHQYLALRLEEQQIKQAEGSSPQLALPGLPDLEPATEQTLLALPAAPEGSLRRHSSPSQGPSKQGQRATELQRRNELNRARIAALQAMPRQHGSSPPLSKKALQTGLTTEVQKAMASLHAVQSNAATATVSDTRPGAAHPAASSPGDAQIKSNTAAKATKAVRQAVPDEKHITQAGTAAVKDRKGVVVAKQSSAAENSQPTSVTAARASAKASDRQDSRRDRSTDQGPSISRQGSKRRRSRSQSRSAAHNAVSQAARRPQSALPRQSRSSVQSARASCRSASQSPPSKRSRQPSGYTGRRRSQSSSTSPDVRHRRQQQRSDRRSPAPARRRRSPSPTRQHCTVSSAKHRSPSERDAAGTRPLSASNRSKAASPTRASSKAGSRPTSQRSSPMRQQASKRYRSTSKSNSPHKGRQLDRQPEVKAQHTDAIRAATEAVLPQQTGASSPAQGKTEATAQKSVPADVVVASPLKNARHATAESAAEPAAQTQSSAVQAKGALSENAVPKPDAQGALCENAVPKPDAQGAHASTGRALAGSVTRLQSGSQGDVIDITAETDSSQMSIDVDTPAAAAAAPTTATVVPKAAVGTTAAAASISKDVKMAEAAQLADAVPAANAAEAFISLELEDARASKSVSPSRPPHQPVQEHSHRSPQRAGRQAPVSAPPAVPVQDSGDSQLQAGSAVTGGSLRPSASYNKASVAADHASGMAALGSGQESISAVPVEQKGLPATRPKPVGKGGIQIVMATKHKEEVSKGGFPFPSLFGAIVAQGLPEQDCISLDVLQPVPQAPRVPLPLGAIGQYNSPLQVFRSYRLADTYETVSRLSLTSATFSHKLDPHWPLCTYDIRGSCRDAKCPYQHASDYQLENVALLRNLHSQAARAGAKAALPVLPGGVITPTQLTGLAKQIVSSVPQSKITLPSSISPRIASPAPQRTQQRLSKQRRHQLATEDPIPSYALHPSGPSSAESHPFKSQLLSLVAVEHEHRPWLLLPGWEGYGNLADYCTVPRTGVDAADSSVLTSATRPGDKMTGRYYQGTHQEAKAPMQSKADPRGSDADKEREQLLANFEQRVAAEPHNEELWVLFALQHIDFGAVSSLKGQKLMASIKCLSNGLEVDSSFTRLWLLYLPLYHCHLLSKGDTHDATDAAQTCLRHSKHCYQLWLTAAQFQPTWQIRATLLQRGIVALARAEPADYQDLSAVEVDGWASMRSSCVLDLALQLLQLWTDADMHDLATAWVNDLVRIASSAIPGRARLGEDPLKLEERAVPAIARQALLHQMQQHPSNAAVLWLACAHLVAYNSFPDQAIHRLGFGQKAAVLTWQQVPPASCHARVRGLLVAAAGPGLGCLDLRTRPEVLGNAGVSSAVAGAWPRQALALTIAHWQLATNCTPLLTLPAAQPSLELLTAEASSLLHLARMTSKAFAHVPQPVPNQAMEAWQQAPWPVGSCQLLSMGLVTAADTLLQAFTTEYGQQALPSANVQLHTAADSSQQTQASIGTQQPAGRLQQMVSAASKLLAELAQAYRQFQVSHAGADGDRSTPDLSPGRSQPAKLPSLVVGAIATRAYQLSNGHAECALAVLVAAALPEWAERRSPAVVSPPWGRLDVTVNGQAEARSGRKRARSSSRSPSRSPQCRRAISSSSSSQQSSLSGSDDSSSSDTPASKSHSNNSSSDSDGSRSMTSHSRSSSLARQSSQPSSPTLPMSRGNGYQGNEVNPWLAVEASGSLKDIETVREALIQRAAPPERSQSPLELEEGEISIADEDVRRTETCYCSLTLALYEAFSGQPSRAAQAMQAALNRAGGNTHLQEQLWQEFLSFAPAALTPMHVPAAAIASSEQLLEDLLPERLRQKVQLWQQFASWQQCQAHLKPLALPKLAVKDARARALIQQPDLQDGEGLKEGCLALLSQATPLEEQALLEALSSGTPSSAAKAQLLLDLAATKPQDAQYAAWMLPLAAAQLLNAAPCAASHLWLQAVVLAERHSHAAALELCTVAVARRPFSSALLKRHTALKSTPQPSA